MPSRAETHIQNTAPGPPNQMAVATPAMLPVPMVEARAVARAWNWEIPRPFPRPRRRAQHGSEGGAEPQGYAEDLEKAGPQGVIQPRCQEQPQQPGGPDDVIQTGEQHDHHLK